MMKRLLYAALVLFITAGSGQAATYYLSPTGSDSNTGASNSRWATFDKFQATASAGDDLIYGTGTYSASGTQINVFNGTSGDYTNVTCEVELGCLISGAGSRTPIDMDGNSNGGLIPQYMNIGGFQLLATGEFAAVSIGAPDGATESSNIGHHVNISTIVFYSGVNTNTNSSGFEFARMSSSTVVNVYGVGQRYTLLFYGVHNVYAERLRASWHRWNPTGSNPAGGLAIYNVKNSTFNHVYVYDQQVGTDAGIQDKRGIYVIGNANGNTAPYEKSENIWVYNSLIVNNELGACVAVEGSSGGGANNNINFVNGAWLGCAETGVTVPQYATNVSFSRITIASAAWDASNTAYGNGTGVSSLSIINSSLLDGGGDGLNGGSWANTYTNIYGMAGSAYSGGESAGTGDTAVNPSYVHAIISTSSALAGDGSGGVDMGADLRFIWTSTGGVTATKAWPLENECTAKTFYTSTASLTYDIFGTTYTYTQYAWRWKYGNNPPSDYASTCNVTDVSSPTAPTNLTVTSTGTTTLDISWTASTDDVGVSYYEIDVSTDNFSTYSAGYSDFNMGSGTTEQLTGLTSSTAYSYRIRAVDATGNTSSNSSTGTGTTSAAASSTGKSISGSFTISGSVTIR